MNDDALAARFKTAVELLEAIAADRSVLARATEEERTRLLQAAGTISRPDAVTPQPG